MRIILEEMGHKQPATPIQTDNLGVERHDGGGHQRKNNTQTIESN
jgi:hypothetical protein